MARNIDVLARNGELRLTAGGETLLLHTPECPAVFAGRGKESIKMYRGNFDVNDRVSERFALRLSSADGETLTFTHPDMQGALTVRITRDGGLLRLHGEKVTEVAGGSFEEIEDGVYLILAEEDEVSVEVQNGETWQYQDGGKRGDGT